MNECENSSLNRCSVSAECSNTDGSYECTCVRGFTGSGYSCGTYRGVDNFPQVVGGGLVIE